MGNVHARQYAKMQDVEILAFDSDEAKLATFCTNWKATPCSNFDDLLARAQAVDVCLPTDVHVEYAERVFAKKKGLFLEKPAAHTYKEAVELAQAAEEAGVVYMVGHVVRYFADYKNLHNAVARGDVGTPSVVRTRRGGTAPRAEWFMDHHKSGGVIIDLAIHEFDWLRWTLGEPVLVDARSKGATTMQGPDYALCTFTFASGAIAHVEATWMDPSGFRTQVEIAGSTGLLQHDSRLASTVVTNKPGAQQFEAPMDGADDPYFLQLSDFVAALRGEKAVAITGWDGAAAVKMAEAALESARRKEPVTLAG